MEETQFVCYNCAEVFDKKYSTKEHIPARNLSDVLSSEYKKNRITVLCCEDCNKSYSSLDEEFRNWIGTMNNNDEFSEISGKTVKSIHRKDKALNRVSFLPNGLIGVKFKKKDIENYHIKNFKGLFYHEYNLPIKNSNYTFLVNFEDGVQQNRQLFIDYLNLFKWKKSGHDDVFQYSIQPFNIQVFNENIKKTDNIPLDDLLNEENSDMFVAIMRYNKQHGVLVIAQRK